MPQQLHPAPVLFGGVLVFLLALGEVGVPMLLRYPVFPTQTLTQFSAFYDFGGAAAAAMPLLAVTALALAVERYCLREKTYRPQAPAPRTAMLRIPLRGWRVPPLIAAGSVATAVTVAPVLALLASGWAAFARPAPVLEALESLWRSLALGALGATLLTVLGFFCGYLIRHRALRLWRAVDTLTLLLFTVPGTVIGVGLIALWNRPATAFVYASPAIVLLAYLAQYAALTSRITLATLANVPRSIEEAAQTSGAPWLSRVVRVVIPSALPGVIGAWLIGFIFCLRDLGASMLVYPSGQDTLPVRIFTLMANGAPSLISALCLILVAVASVALAAVGLLLRAAGGAR